MAANNFISHIHVFRIVMQKLIYVLLIGLGIFLAGCATPRKPGEMVASDVSFVQLCQDSGISWEWDGITQIITLRWGNATAKVLVGSPVVGLGEEILMLDVPLRIDNSTVIVTTDFQSKIIDYLKAKKEEVSIYAFLKLKEVIVDPGHGGRDPGAIGPSGLQEKDVVFDIAQRLAQELARHGVRILLTRETDEFISLQERALMAGRSKADLFVSIHANSHPSRGVQGVEVYSLRPLDSFEMNDSPRQENYEALLNHLALEKNNGSLRQILSDMLFVSKQA